MKRLAQSSAAVALLACASAAHAQLSERDEVDLSRGDKALYLGRRAAGPFGGQPSEDAWRIEQLRARHP